jgi:hypothetical protein
VEEKEEWKEHDDPDLRSTFLISNLGRVKSISTNRKTPRLLKGYKNMGYHAIPTRKKDGKNTLVYVHKLVAKLFVPNPEGYAKIVFKDYDRGNCKASNLKWVSEKDYLKYRKKFQRSAYYYNPNHKPNAKLSATDVIRLRKMVNDPNRKTRYKIIAKQFGINIGTLFAIKRGDSWKDLNESDLKK